MNPSEIPEPSEEILGYIQDADGNITEVTTLDVLQAQPDEELDEDYEPID